METEKQFQRMSVYFPPDLLEKVRMSARKHRRSFNKEALWLLEQTLAQEEREEEAKHDAGWSTFIAMCEYKAENAGTVKVVKVDPYKTSQVCSGCLHEGPHKDLSERVHICEACGLVLDRDVNAAKNILAVWQDGLHLHPAPKEKQPKTKKNAQAWTELSEDAPLRSLRL